MRRPTRAVVLAAVPAVVAVGLALVGVAAAIRVPRPLGDPPALVTTCCAAALVVLALIYGRRHRGVPRERQWDRRGRLLIAVTSGLVLLACTLVTALTAYAYGWDPVTVQQVAEGTREPGSARRYFSVYPNILPMLMLGKLAVWVEGVTGVRYEHVFIAVAAASLAVTLAAGIAWLHRRGAQVGHAIGFVLLLGVIVGISPWMGVPYTDLVALPIPLAVVALLSLLPDVEGRRRILLIAATAVLTGIGWAFKTTPVVLLAAVVVGIVLTSRRRTTRRGRAVTAATAVAATAVAAAAGLRTQVYADGQRCYGCFDRDITRPVYGATVADQRAHAHAAIRAAISSRSATEHVRFYANKTLHTWGDGMFFAWGEGLDIVEPLQHPAAEGTLAARINSTRGDLLGERTAVVGGLWAGVLLLAAVRLWQHRRDWDIVAVSSAIAGLVVFTTLFQGRGRYVLVLAPVLIALACLPDPDRAQPDTAQ